jgi:hypothetical protein
MAIDFNGALTLADYASISNDPLVKEITKSLHKTWNALKDIPLSTNPTLRQTGMRYLNANIPVPNWTGLNAEPQTFKSKPKSYEEQLYILRNKLTVDRRILDQPNAIVDPVESQIQMFLEGFAYDFNDKFINNDPSSTVVGNTADCFPGLNYRLKNNADYDIPSEMIIPSTADLSTNTTSGLLVSGTGSGSANRFMAEVQNLFDNMNAPDGDGVVLYMSELCKRQIEMAIRVMGIGAGFDITQDSYDRPVEKYKNATIRTVGRKSDGVTPVISNTQTQNVASTLLSVNSANRQTSIYAVRYGTGYVTGWQSEPFKPKYLGLSPENGIMHNVLFDWGVGLWIPHNRAIGRIDVVVTP